MYNLISAACANGDPPLKEPNHFDSEKFPTIIKLLGSSFLPTGFDWQTVKDNFRYNFDVEKYLAGDLLMQNVTAPYYVRNSLVPTTAACGIDVGRHGDILWKLVVTGVNLEKVSIWLNGNLFFTAVPTPRPTQELIVPLFNDKGIPMIALRWSDFEVKCDNANAIVTGVYQYFINLDTHDRKTLSNRDFIWPEGKFVLGYFKEPEPVEKYPAQPQPKPIECVSFRETLFYLITATSQAERLEFSSLEHQEVPTIERLLGTDSLLKGKFPYYFDPELYLAGDLLIEHCSVPYYVIKMNGGGYIGRDGDILWKLVITGVNLKNVILEFNGNALFETDATPESTEIEIKLFNGKGLPLVALRYDHSNLVIYSSECKIESVSQYFVNIINPERSILAKRPKFTWPEGEFREGEFIPSEAKTPPH